MTDSMQYKWARHKKAIR